MAGIYIHIPFCKQKCNYCDFYKTTQVLQKPQFINALLNELEQRKSWLSNEEVKTIYFGGGTPSLLTINEIIRIIDTIYSNFNVVKTPEITLECNPDDLTKKQIENIRHTPVNRLSIGIQSFQNNQLKFMNRRHNATQAVDCVKMAQDAGFNNISTDLIYGLPNLSLKNWELELEQMGKLNVQHLSAYHLTIESGTVFHTMKNKGLIKTINEDESIQQFELLIQWARQNGFEHYEISNFAHSGYYSQHNTSYWQQETYLGAGPSAHSYNQKTRLWNVSDLAKYISGIHNNEVYYESENLSENDKYNEFLMTWLRTCWGVDIKKIGHLFGLGRQLNLKKAIQPYINDGNVYKKENRFILSDKGIFISDTILADLMVLDD